jgi:hypothetical protein
MQLSTVPNDFIISIPNENGENVKSDFLLHALKIKNDSNENLILKGISFELKYENQLVKKIIYCEKALDDKIEMLCNEVSFVTCEEFSKLYFGTKDFWSYKDISKSNILTPGGESGIFNEYFIEVHKSKIDELVIKVDYITGDKLCTEAIALKVVEYKCKNEYIFPVKGTYSTCGNYNDLLGHRQHYSMEYAIDMSQLNIDQKLEYKDTMKNEDYIAYGQEVIAIAAGEIVACHHEYTEKTPWVWKDRKVYIEKYGHLPSQCGNHVVIKHENGEYSLYGHLMPNSLPVNKGDRVKQGQSIGKIGNTGLSNCPHLHFQLMDGADFFGSRGLPCYFTNLKDISRNEIDILREDNLIVHTF